MIVEVIKNAKIEDVELLLKRVILPEHFSNIKGFDIKINRAAYDITPILKQESQNNVYINQIIIDEGMLNVAGTYTNEEFFVDMNQANEEIIDFCIRVAGQSFIDHYLEGSEPVLRELATSEEYRSLIASGVASFEEINQYNGNSSYEYTNHTLREMYFKRMLNRFIVLRAKQLKLAQKHCALRRGETFKQEKETDEVGYRFAYHAFNN